MIMSLLDDSKVFGKITHLEANQPYACERAIKPMNIGWELKVGFHNVEKDYFYLEDYELWESLNDRPDLTVEIENLSNEILYISDTKSTITPNGKQTFAISKFKGNATVCKIHFQEPHSHSPLKNSPKRLIKVTLTPSKEINYPKGLLIYTYWSDCF